MEEINKYANGKIYKICDINETEFYIGSTIEKYLANRMGKHRTAYRFWIKNNKPSYKFSTVFNLFEKYGLKNCKIILIAKINCQTKEELLKEENEYIKNINCVNKQLAISTIETKKEKQKQYQKLNKDKINKNSQLYKSKNRDKILVRRRELYKQKNPKKIHELIKCVCGHDYTKPFENRHLKSQKHLKCLI
jgi:hypothetical protein